MATVEWPGYDKLARGLDALRDPDANPLMEEWCRIEIEGNRRGVLAGVDGNGQPMPPLKYRNGKGRKTGFRRGKMTGTSTHPLRAGPLGTAAEYRKLTGPRLAPHREASRVITNLHAGWGREAGGEHRWYAEAVWFDVESDKGYHFLEAHFDPKAGSRLPRYDLRPVRAEDVERAEAALLKWGRAFLRAVSSGG